MSDYQQEQEPEQTEAPIEPVQEEQRDEELRLGEEFRELGRQLMRAFRSVADSDELRNLSNEVVDSLRDIGEEVQETFQRTRQKEEVKAVGERAKRVGQAVSSGASARELTTELQSGLSQALRSLNNELNKVIDQIQARSARMGDEVEGTAREAAGELQEDAADENSASGEFRSEVVEETPVPEGPVDADEPTGLADPETVGRVDPATAEQEGEVKPTTANKQDDDVGALRSVTGVKSREEEKNQPEYLGDMADAAVAHLEENGPEMSPAAEELLQEGRDELHGLVESPEEAGGDAEESR
jgi:hypothetical protein